MSRIARPRAESIRTRLESLRRRATCAEYSEVGQSSAFFLDLVSTHGNPPESLQPLRQALVEALAPRLSDKRRAERLRRAAGHVPRWNSADGWPKTANLVLLEFAASLDARPSDRWELIQLCFDGLLVPRPGIGAITPRNVQAPTARMGTWAELTALIERQIMALCAEALKEVCLNAPFNDWSMTDIYAALFAIRYLYCALGRTVCGESALAKPRQEDFKRVGQPLWNTLRQAAISLAARQRRPVLYDADWHQRAQAAVYLSISVAPPDIDSESKVSESGISGPSLVVCRRPIAAAADKTEKEEVERHRVLEHPLPLTPMPARNKVEAARQRLLREFPWAGDVLDVIFGDLIGRAAVGAATLSMPPTLLVGRSGSGKSRLARRLAQELGPPRLDLCLAGSADTKMISGTSRGWASSKPSDLAVLMATQRSASLVVILDELDKAHDNQRDGVGIQAYLLGLLEQETACRHTDVFLKTACDYSGVLWLATANSLRDIAPALLTRFRILVLKQPEPEHFEAISHNVIAELAARWGVDRAALPDLNELRLPLDRLGSARQVRVAAELAVTQWAKDLQKH